MIFEAEDCGMVCDSLGKSNILWWMTWCAVGGDGAGMMGVCEQGTLIGVVWHMANN